MMKRLIVNADDFGLTEGINRGIIDGHEKGIITSASLMTNMPAFDQAVTLAKKHPQLGVGVHLTLVNGPPATKPSHVPSLLGRCGFFLDNPIKFVGRLASGRVKITELELELRTQVEKALRALGSVTHIDGHQHLHMNPRILRSVLTIAREYQIRHVRWSSERLGSVIRVLSEIPSVKFLSQHCKARLIAYVARRGRKHFVAAGFTPPAHVLGITHTGFLDASALRGLLQRLPEGTTELICHPGYVTQEIERVPTRLKHQREIELEALMSPVILNFIRSERIELINFRNL